MRRPEGRSTAAAGGSRGAETTNTSRGVFWCGLCSWSRPHVGRPACGPTSNGLKGC